MYLNFNATKFTKVELKAAVKKRYSDEIHDDDLTAGLEDAITAQQTLGQAADAIVKLYVETDGHERNLILTPEELAIRKEKGDKIGIVKAIIAAMRKAEGATENDLKVAVRYQVTLRKLKAEPNALGSHIVSTLCSELGFAVMLESRTSTVWKLAKKPHARNFPVDKLTDDELMALCPDFKMFIQQDYHRRAQRQEATEEY